MVAVLLWLVFGYCGMDGKICFVFCSVLRVFVLMNNSQKALSGSPLPVVGRGFFAAPLGAFVPAFQGKGAAKKQLVLDSNIPTVYLGIWGGFGFDLKSPVLVTTGHLSQFETA